jgi:4-hydroxyphenylpyruvate dioxygenase
MFMEELNKDFLPIEDNGFVEFYVSNSLQAAYYYMTAFGFQPLAYAGLSTGSLDKESYVVKQGTIRFVFSSPLHSGTDMGRHIDKHGDGVKKVAFLVKDATTSYHTSVAKGAVPDLAPQTFKDEDGQVVLSSIHTYGETIHVFVELKDYKGPFLPGFKAWNPTYKTKEIGLKRIDHMVGNVGWGKMNEWVNFYANVLGFIQIKSFDDKDISTEYTALMSKVMGSGGDGKIKFPINEPAEGKKRSQIEEYINFYEGEGVQHIAMSTDNIISTVKELIARGVEFLRVPDEYYNRLLERVGKIDEELLALKELGILVDRDEEGYLLQLFSKPVGPRPTMFFEIIQRKGSTSFGKGNFKALFEAIELEQGKRGTL